MTWEETCIVLVKYYEGINLLDIPKMTLHQVAYLIRGMDWLESQARETGRITSSASTIMGGQPGSVPSTSDIRALARQINPNIVIPENHYG